jgi:hypothetical protein
MSFALPLKVKWINLLLDSVAVLLIIITPAVTHLTGIPFYMMEPMRLMLVLSMAHSNRINTYLLAAALPLLSWLLTGHPFFLKMIIISGELLLNTALFYFFTRNLRSVFLPMLSSILISKIACYLAYGLAFSWSFVQEEAGILFLVIQLFMMIVFSTYIYIMRRKSE